MKEREQELEQASEKVESLTAALERALTSAAAHEESVDAALNELVKMETRAKHAEEKLSAIPIRNEQNQQLLVESELLRLHIELAEHRIRDLELALENETVGSRRNSAALESLGNELKTATEVNRSLASKTQTLEIEIGAASLNIRELEEQRDTAMDQLRKMEEELLQWTERAESSEAEILTLRANLIATAEIADELFNETGHKVKEIEERDKRIATIEIEKTDLESKINDFARHLQESQSLFRSAHESLEFAMEKKNLELASELRESQSLLSELRLAHDASNSDHQQMVNTLLLKLSECVDLHNSEISVMMEREELLRAQSNHDKVCLQQQKLEIEELQGDLQRNITTVGLLNTELKATLEAKEKLFSDVAGLEEILRTRGERIALLERQLADLQNRFDVAEKTYRDSDQGKLTQLEAELDGMQKRLIETEGVLTLGQTELGIREKDLSDLRVSFAALCEKSSQQEAELARVNLALATTERSVSEMSEQLKEKGAKIEASEEMIKVLINQCATLTQERDEAEARSLQQSEFDRSKASDNADRGVQLDVV